MPCFRKTWRSGKHVLWNFARVTGSSCVSRTSWSGTMFWRAQRTGVPHGNLSSLDTGLASFQGRSRFPSIYGLELEINQQSAVWVLDNVALIQETPYEGGWSWTWMPQTGDCLDCLDCLEPETLLWYQLMWYDMIWWYDMMISWYDRYVWMLCVVRWELWGTGADWDFPRTIPSDRHPFWWWNSSVGALAKDSKSPFDPLPFLKAPWNKCIIHDETVRFCGSRFIFETVPRVPIVLFLRFSSVQF